MRIGCREAKVKSREALGSSYHQGRQWLGNSGSGQGGEKGVGLWV